jgi:hypothetical protein
LLLPIIHKSSTSVKMQDLKRQSMVFFSSILVIWMM